MTDGPPNASFAGELIADKRGFFGPEVMLRPYPDATDFAETVARERAVGVTTGSKFLLAAWQGIPITAFAASFLDTSMAIFALENSGIRQPADLVGRRIGYRPGNEGEIILEALIAQLGLPRSQIVKVPGADTFDTLRTAKVDAIVATILDTPDPSKEGALRVNIIRPQDYSIHVPGLVYFVSNELLNERPSIVLKILQGLILGWRDVYSDYSQSVPIIVEYDQIKLRQDRVRFELQLQRSLVQPPGGRIGDYDESRWRTLRDILLFSKVGRETVSISQVVNFRFVRDVYLRAPDQEARANGGR